MDSILIIGIIAAVLVFAFACFIAFKEIKRISDDKSNKKLFLNNSSQIEKGQSLDEVISLLGRPTTYTEMDGKYILKWEQIEETGLNSITRSITVILSKEEIVIDIHRENMD